jgi:hypothetical protein
LIHCCEDVSLDASLVRSSLDLRVYAGELLSERLLARFSQSIEKRTRRGEAVRPHSRGFIVLAAMLSFVVALALMMLMP